MKILGSLSFENERKLRWRAFCSNFLQRILYANLAQRSATSTEMDIKYACDMHGARMICAWDVHDFNRSWYYTFSMRCWLGHIARILHNLNHLQWDDFWVYHQTNFSILKISSDFLHESHGRARNGSTLHANVMIDLISSRKRKVSMQPRLFDDDGYRGFGYYPAASTANITMMYAAKWWYQTFGNFRKDRRKEIFTT